MRTGVKSLRLWLSVAIVCAGCALGADPVLTGTPVEAPGKPGATNATLRGIEDLPADAVLIRVNDAAMTRADFDRVLAIRRYQLDANNAKLKEAQRKGLLLRAQQRIVPQFVTTQLLLQEARAQKVQPTADDRKKTMEELAFFAKRMGKPTVEQYLQDAPVGEAFMRQELENQLLVNTLLAKAGSAVTVTEERVTAIVTNLQARAEAARKTNEVQRAALLQIRQQLLAGADFAAMAKAHSDGESAEEGGLVGSFERRQIEDRALRKVIFGLSTNAAATNAFSEVLDSDDAYRIVKVLEIKPPRIDADGGEEAGEVRVVAQIAKAKMTAEPVPTPAEARATCTKQLADEARRAFIEGLRQRARIEYPSGTNFLVGAQLKATR